MSVSNSGAAAPLSAIERLKRAATLPGASQVTSSVSATQPATAAAAAQANQGAAAVQPTAEVFNAPALELPDNPSTRDVMAGLTRAMADPTVNDSSIQKLYSLHEQLLNAERTMLQSIIDGMLI